MAGGTNIHNIYQVCSPTTNRMGNIRQLVFILVVIFVLLSGCLQAPAAPVTPVPPTSAPSVPTPTVPEPKQINVTAYETDKSVVLLYTGGKDADLLSMFRVQIDNKDGKIVKTPIYYPEIGKEYDFAYVGIPNPRTINVIGVFKDGTEQTLMIKYF